MSSKSQVEANIQTFLRIRPSKKPSGYFEEVNGEREDVEKLKVKHGKRFEIDIL